MFERITNNMTEAEMGEKFAGEGFVMDRWGTLFAGYYSYSNYGPSRSYWHLAPINERRGPLLGKAEEQKLDYPVFWISVKDVIELIRKALVKEIAIC